MYGKHFNVNIFSRNSLSTFLNEQWLQDNQTLKKKKLQMEDFFSSQEDDSSCSPARNVSSIELYKLLHVNSSIICSKNKCKHKNSGDHIIPPPHILNYSRIILQTCQNKGCMCKPIIQGKPKCQINDEEQANTDGEVAPRTETRNATNRIYEVEIDQEETSNPSKIESKTSETKTATSQNEILDTQINNYNKNEEPDTVSEPKHASGESDEEQSKIFCCFKICKNKNKGPKTKPIQYPMCKKNPCNPCPNEMRFCVPSNFEELLKEHDDKAIQFMHCINRDLCTCDKYDTEDGLKRGLKLPGKNICMQSAPLSIILDEPKSHERSLKTEESSKNGESPKNESPRNEGSIKEEKQKNEEEPKEVQEVKVEEKPNKSEKLKIEEPVKKEEVKSEQNSSSISKNTCCFCFKKKASKKSSDKSIQTCKCCSNKICQKERSIICFCGSDKKSDIHQIGEPVADKIKSIWLCSKCGKIYNSTCKKCEKNSCTRNTIILPTSPGMVLCNDQTETLRTLIKLEAKQNFRQIDNILQELNEQKSEIKKLNDMCQSISNSIKSKNNMKIGDNSETNGLNNQKVYICEGCEFDVNKNILRTLLTRGERRSSDDKIFDSRQCEDPYEGNDKKYLKNVMNKRKRIPPATTTEVHTKSLDEKEIQTQDSKYNLPARQDNFIETKGKRHQLKRFTTDTDEGKSQVVPDVKMNAKVQTEKLDHIREKKETEQPSTDQISKTDPEVQPNECPFITWWKKSLTNLKQKQSKDILKSKYLLLQKKISDCKKSLTHTNEKQSKNKLKCNYQYLQAKMNDCKTSYTSPKEKENTNAEKSNQYLKDKADNCKKFFTNPKQKKNNSAEKCNYQFVKNKITQCTEKVRATKTKKGLMCYGVNYFQLMKKK